MNDQSKRKLQTAIKKRNKAARAMHDANTQIAYILRQLHSEGASYSELGAILNVSRQRIHQIVKGD